jgi:hypothetical protein
MFQYSVDHEGAYPSGQNSTEAFQKLLDGGYVTDASIFYISIGGKTKLDAGRVLKPENVCWDVTSPLNTSSSDGLPIVFPTGYKVQYVPGGGALPLVKPYPKYMSSPPHAWWERLYDSSPPEEITGVGVCYKNNSAAFLKLKMSADGNYSIPNFVPAYFDPGGQTYRQLTPNGELGDE